jgi:hypothetical protein
VLKLNICGLWTGGTDEDEDGGQRRGALISAKCIVALFQLKDALKNHGTAAAAEVKLLM